MDGEERGRKRGRGGEGDLSPGFFNRLSGTAEERGKDMRGGVRKEE